MIVHNWRCVPCEVYWAGGQTCEWCGGEGRLALPPTLPAYRCHIYEGEPA